MSQMNANHAQGAAALQKAPESGDESHTESEEVSHQLKATNGCLFADISYRIFDPLQSLG